jgi:hypothetical protein
MGYTSYSTTGERTIPVKSKNKKKEKQAPEEENIFKIPEGNMQGKVDVSNPEAVKQQMRTILNAPVSQPIGNTRELKPSSHLGLKQDKRKEIQEKRREKQKEEKGEREAEAKTAPPKRKTEEEEEAEDKGKKVEKQKMVFSDKKDYVQHQIKVLKERADNKDKNISAHRYGEKKRGRQGERGERLIIIFFI